MERVRVSDPERALRLPDLVPMLEQREKRKRKGTMRKGTFFSERCHSVEYKKCKFCRKGSVFHQAVMVEKKHSLFRVFTISKDSENGQVLSQHCKMGCFHRKEPTD